VSPDAGHDARHEPAHHLLTRTRRRSLTGLGLSILIHVGLMGVLALILFDAPRGQGRTYGPALEIQSGPSTAQADASDAWLDESLPDLSEAVPMPEIEPGQTASDLSVISSSAGAPASLAGGAGAADADGLSLGGAAGGGASFFGVEAAGSRIVYIVDISGSMLHNGKIEALRRELLGSIEALPPGSEFAVVIFSDAAATRALGGSPRWHDAGAQGRAGIETAIRAISPAGGTEPLEAFRIAFALSPKPEAMYFMTDGELPQRDAAKIIGSVRAMNESAGPRTPIHCIAFGSRSGAGDLRCIARQSGGTYTYVSARGR